MKITWILSNSSVLPGEKHGCQVGGFSLNSPAQNVIVFKSSCHWEIWVFRGILNYTMSTGLADLRDMFLVVIRKSLGMFPENLKKFWNFSKMTVGSFSEGGCQLFPPKANKPFWGSIRPAVPNLQWVFWMVRRGGVQKSHNWTHPYWS